ncbi:N-alpha-acetyltransferase 30, partial [Blomia tropicalis]
MPNSNRLVKDNDKETSETLEDELETKLNFTEQTTKPNTNVIYFETNDNSVEYVNYQDERQMPDIMRLIQKDLSEPYSIYTYRYFIHNWPQLCFLGVDDGKCIGAIVCKLDFRKNKVLRGYIAMLAVDEKYRKRKIGTNLVLKAINVMIESNADEVVLETEVTNKPALRLYENLGFVRDKRLFRYYLNGVDALRLKLWLK